MSLTEISVRGVRKPIVRYVYLVQDLSDAARMGGVPENTYTTYQAAYNAANALQLLLGGTNRVGIMVGVTTAAVVGSCSATSWNPDVFIVGLHRSLSNIGPTTITTVAATTIRVKNITVGGINSEGGININMENAGVFGALNTASTTGNAGSITITAINSSTGNLGATSTAGNSGNILINNCSNIVVGTINQTTSLGNVGTFILNAVSNSTLGTITRTATDPVGNWSIGTFSMINCRGNVFSNITMSITNAASTGTIEVFINRTNQANIFNGTVSILGCTTTSRSDVGIDLEFNSCVFNQPLLVNTTGTFISERGGWIKRLVMQDCESHIRTRFVNWPLNPHDTDPVLFDLNVIVKDCEFYPLSTLSGGFYFQNNDVGYATFLIKDCESNEFNVGIRVGVNVTTPPVIPFMIDGAFIDYQNVKSNISISTADPIVNTAPYNCIINNCNGYWGYFEAYDGDFNFQLNFCNFTTASYGEGFGGITPLTKPFYINSCNMGAQSGYFTLNGGTAGINFIIKNSQFTVWTDVLNPLTFLIPSVYNSLIESVADVGSGSSFTGTLYTSTIRRLVTETVAGVVLNNSYDDPY